MKVRVTAASIQYSLARFHIMTLFIYSQKKLTLTSAISSLIDFCLAIAVI